jgi:hypothetical protein
MKKKNVSVKKIPPPPHLTPNYFYQLKQPKLLHNLIKHEENTVGHI